MRSWIPVALCCSLICLSAHNASAQTPAHPAIDFDTLLFVGWMWPQCEDHMITQYLGWNARAGGGLYLLTGLKSGSPQLVDLLQNSTVQGGRLDGQSLSGGAFLSPDLSYDGTQVLFAWTNTTDACYHIFKVNLDGTGLVQLTDGSSSRADVLLPDMSHNEFDPCWLPNGRIVFVSERRGGYGRCHPDTKPTYTLFSMMNDGTDIIPISYHETNEWHPSINNDGMIVYTRWDYLDRDDCIAHHMWTCYPDGRDPRAPHGNYPDPATTMEGSSWPDGRTARPNGEWNIRAIPNSSKYVATAAAHHRFSTGEIIILDPTVADDNAMSQITNVTATTTAWPDFGQGAYATAWPLSEEHFLCNKNNSIVLLEANGNETVLYETTEPWRPIDPIPVRPRTRPPVLSTQTWQGHRRDSSDHYRATIGIIDVTYGDMPLPQDVNITAMRILQVIPKVTPEINIPRTGYASEALARLSLGTVPVESDGSVYCEAPVGREIYFQLLDENGMAVHSMRAATYVHPGEQLSCIGCHEDKWTAVPPPSTTPLAFRRPPSALQPETGAEPGGFTPINYHRLVKPVFDSKCAPCHQQQGLGPADMSYSALEPYAFYFCSGGTPYLNGDIRTAVRGGSRTIPGMFGALYSRMGRAMLDSTHQDAGITAEEFQRVCLWLDGNSMELSAYTEVGAQQAGQLVIPEMDFDSLNPTGVERDFPAPGGSRARKQIDRDRSRCTVGIRASTGRLRITGASGADYTLLVYDARGRICAVRPVAHGETIGRSDLGVSRGTYLAQIRTAGGSIVGEWNVVLW